MIPQRFSSLRLGRVFLLRSLPGIMVFIACGSVRREANRVLCSSWPTRPKSSYLAQRPAIRASPETGRGPPQCHSLLPMTAPFTPHPRDEPLSCIGTGNPQRHSADLRRFRNPISLYPNLRALRGAGVSLSTATLKSLGIAMRFTEESHSAPGDNYEYGSNRRSIGRGL